MSFFKALKTLFSSAPKRSVSECHGLVRQGKAIIVDVREPNECKSGYADKAYLLPLSDLTGEKKLWTAALSRNRDKEIFLYCAAGSRSGMATKSYVHKVLKLIILAVLKTGLQADGQLRSE